MLPGRSAARSAFHYARRVSLNGYTEELFDGSISEARRKMVKQHKGLSNRIVFRLSVKDVVPEIWRRFQASSDITLVQLHSIVQVLMGWGDRHLYAFVIGTKRYSSPSDVDDDIKNRSLIRTKLSNILVNGSNTFTYEYDFGDGWQIKLDSEPIDDDFHANRFAECIDGSRHGPVEDSGGSRGYMEKALIYRNPHHRRYQDIRELIGPDFDSEAFDLARTNAMLKAIG
jgi:hypothetical protein